MLQVRCVAAVLIMVGQGLEPPSVVAQLLDVDRHPAKPQYNMAPEVRPHFTAGVPQAISLGTCGYLQLAVLVLQAETFSTCLSMLQHISCEKLSGLRLLCVHVMLNVASAAAQLAEAPR